ncbi:MAG: hypothetical protein KDA96_09070 [Planctomycetaceae bacterium]|nr:hypothetical protein [Planctomycetaceae bacterium]
MRIDAPWIRRLLQSTAVGAILLQSAGLSAGDFLIRHEERRPQISPACMPNWGFHQTCWRVFPPLPPCDSDCGVCGTTGGLNPAYSGSVNDYPQPVNTYRSITPTAPLSVFPPTMGKPQAEPLPHTEGGGYVPIQPDGFGKLPEYQPLPQPGMAVPGVPQPADTSLIPALPAPSVPVPQLPATPAPPVQALPALPTPLDGQTGGARFPSRYATAGHRAVSPGAPAIQSGAVLQPSAPVIRPLSRY